MSAKSECKTEYKTNYSAMAFVALAKNDDDYYYFKFLVDDSWGSLESVGLELCQNVSAY